MAERFIKVFLILGKTTLETESKETFSNTPGVPEVKPQVPAAAPASGGNNDNSQQQNTIESQNYSLDFKSGTFIKNTGNSFL